MVHRAPRAPWKLSTNTAPKPNPLLIILLVFLRWFRDYSRQHEESAFQGLERMQVFIGESPTQRDHGGNYTILRSEILEILEELGLR
jgi:hypothetical protein